MKQVTFVGSSIFIFLFLAFSYAPTSYGASTCRDFYYQHIERHFQRVDFTQALPKNISSELSALNIPRPNLLEEGEWRQFEDLPDKTTIHLVAGKIPPKAPAEGLLIDPSARGVVVNSAAPWISMPRSEKLFDELQKFNVIGNLLMFSREGIDGGMLRKLERKGIVSSPESDGYYKIPDHIFIKEFIKHLKSKTNIPKEQASYVKQAIEGMVDSGRIAQGPHYQKKLIGIRMRWKKDGQGSDFDTVHTDFPSTSIATTLALVGQGTEVFFTSPSTHTLEVRSVSNNQIAHMLGRESGYSAVRHRSTTELDRRIVIILFWN